MLHSQLVQPLAQLLEAARTVSQGSFSARVAHVGEDELGRVGQAFNAMVGEIAAMYTHLADKVEEKTRELQRTNESLELLYRVSQKLSASDLTLDQVQEVLREVEVALELGHSMICVSENNQLPAHTVSGDLSLEERHALCSRRDCGECFLNAQQPLLEQGRTSSALLIVPIGDGDHLRGVLPVLKGAGSGPAAGEGAHHRNRRPPRLQRLDQHAPCRREAPPGGDGRALGHRPRAARLHRPVAVLPEDPGHRLEKSLDQGATRAPSPRSSSRASRAPTGSCAS
ncbi:MAG: HAMP domain-containing protein [Burkholderiales bacterium]|nr:HAMP domain-containing protein [Burkholderiales bacterium]